MFALAPAQTFVGNYMKSFQDFPPRQKPGSFNLSNAMEKIMSGSPNN